MFVCGCLLCCIFFLMHSSKICTKAAQNSLQRNFSELLENDVMWQNKTRNSIMSPSWWQAAAIWQIECHSWSQSQRSDNLKVSSWQLLSFICELWCCMVTNITFVSARFSIPIPTTAGSTASVCLDGVVGCGGYRLRSCSFWIQSVGSIIRFSRDRLKMASTFTTPSLRVPRDIYSYNSAS